MNWQPIETAPKDGTAILAIDVNIEDTHQIVYYEERHPKSLYVWHMSDSCSVYHRDRFTHWMPLPAQPTQEPKP